MLDYTDIHTFKDWWLTNRVMTFSQNAVRTMPFVGTTLAGMQTLLYRKANFQVELFAFPEGSIVTEHGHPNVRSYEVYVGGTIAFTLDSKWYYEGEQGSFNQIDEDFGHALYLEESRIHGALFGQGGGTFISIQEWLNNVSPSCVGDDWNGVASVTNQTDLEGSYVKPKPTWQDAATKEKSLPNNWAGSKIFKNL